jgi:hypothetical protein
VLADDGFGGCIPNPSTENLVLSGLDFRLGEISGEGMGRFG